jgi:hypothetical protein
LDLNANNLLNRVSGREQDEKEKTLTSVKALQKQLIFINLPKII